MSEDAASEISPEAIHAVLQFLPVFEGPGYSFGEWHQSEGQFPFFSHSREVVSFVQTPYDQNVLIRFDWMSWGEEAERYQEEPGALETADLLTLRKLLTAHVRADRLSEGHLANVLESGHITDILRRMKQMRPQV